MNFLSLFKKHLSALFCSALIFSVHGNAVNGQSPDPDKIGVLYVMHSGYEIHTRQHMWNAVVEMFSYDHNHGVYRFVIWNPAVWPAVLDMETTEWAREFIIKYDF